MRKTVLLFTTMALALLLAGGVALAATVQCQAGVVCNGTSGADTITGTSTSDTINGLAGNDIIKARDGNDKIDGGPDNGGTVDSAELMNGEDGSDTYKGYAPGRATGVDAIQDTPVLTTTTNVDKLNLAKFNLADTTFAYGAFLRDAGYTFLRITLPDGSQINLLNYFDGTSFDLCSINPGTGLIEKIIFADDPNVDFAQVKGFACSATAARSPAPGNIREVQLPRSAAPQLDSSNVTNGVTTNLPR